MTIPELFLEFLDEDIVGLGETQADIADAHIRYYEELEMLGETQEEVTE